MADYPTFVVPENHVEPVPRRIRAVLDGQTVVDTTDARYVWECPPSRSTTCPSPTSWPTPSSTRGPPRRRRAAT